ALQRGAAQRERALRGLHPRHRLEQRGLAGAVGSEHRDDLALAHGERHVLERDRLAVPDRQAGDFEQGLHAASVSGALPPMYASMTRGCATIFSGTSSAIISPKSSAITRSTSFMNSCSLCSISSTVSPVSAWIFVISADRSAISPAPSPAKGSSSSSSFGPVARARAISSRRWSP